MFTIAMLAKWHCRELFVNSSPKILFYLFSDLFDDLYIAKLGYYDHISFSFVNIIHLSSHYFPFFNCLLSILRKAKCPCFIILEYIPVEHANTSARQTRSYRTLSLMKDHYKLRFYFIHNHCINAVLSLQLYPAFL